ncbi:FAD-binding dehydrogenase [Shimia thalassica]|uniref:FAD-binding dehydrogenase n=1 Tax=Shimia thalassica TaxID=1715693 RepID=UPI0026E20627|nr:FAD-binding dehydrogenase [Shimia thalassica]MDO6523726.1 FAD-binding dehydrogenase [Shimia thalassica]
MGTRTDAIVVGGGLAGLVAATEAAEAGLKVVILEQESEANLGGQAFWSLGGLFMVDTPEQRRFGIKDSFDLAWADWRGAAGFDRDEDHWPQKWARAYVEFAAGEKREWLRSMGHRIFPVVGWAERGGIDASSHGNSVPRFHITWGTGPGTVEVFENRARAMVDEGKITFKFRHQVDDLIIEAGACVGVKGSLLAEDNADRGKPTNRDVVGDFEMRAPAVIVCSGGIGGNLDLVRQSWPERLGKPPSSMIKGVPAHVDGRMIGISEGAGANTINKDRMWHYVEGVRNWDPIWPDHAIRILPGPSSMWFDATGKRMVEPNYPGYDSLGSLEAIMKTGYDYTWFITTQSIIKKEFALSGSEQNPDLTGKNWKMVAGRAFGPKATGPVEAFKEHGEDFVVADTLPELIAKMNGVAGTDLLDVEQVQRQIEDRDRQLDNKFTKDQQIMGIRTFRNYLGDKLIRTAKPHKILDPKHGPLIGVRLNILTRKTLGGLETDLGGRCFRQEEGRGAQVMPGLYAAGEVSGFGGGGYHGYRALEGTFLGGCIFSGRQAGRAAAGDVK